MSSVRLSHPTGKIIGRINIPGSKSETNRLLILKQLHFPKLRILNVSNSRDTQILQQALADNSDVINVGDAGTAMRFLTAFLAIQDKKKTLLKGSKSMYKRPIGILVDALRQLGAEINYLEEEGFPPLEIIGKKLQGNTVEIEDSVSSQYITALMLIAPSLQGGLEIILRGLSVSTPYTYLTANLMRRLSFKVKMDRNRLMVEPFVPETPELFVVEPDWSAASYWFSMALLARKAEIYLPGFKQHSLQGDAFVAELFKPLGVESHFIGSGFRLRKREVDLPEEFKINLIHNPDLVQALAVALVAKNIPSHISGLKTLKIKETDRLIALKNELEKTGAVIETGKDYLKIHKGIRRLEEVVFDTYNDHRMAMSLTALALLFPIVIHNPEVVEKSYQSFWEDMKRINFWF